MATRGPVPKRSDQRRRRNATEPVSTIARGIQVDVPVADETWHPIAKRWFESLEHSGQSVFYEASDWAHAEYVAEAMSRNLINGRFSAQLFAAVLSGMTELLTTEGARRRARLEIEQDAGVAQVAQIDWRARASAGA